MRQNRPRSGSYGAILSSDASVFSPVCLHGDSAAEGGWYWTQLSQGSLFRVWLRSQGLHSTVVGQVTESL